MKIDVDGESETVEGNTYGNDESGCGIVFVPQSNRGRTSWTDRAEIRTGDDRYGIAIGPDDDTRSPAIRATVASLRTDVGVDHVVLVGASIGGGAAVEAAAEVDPPSTA